MTPEELNSQTLSLNEARYSKMPISKLISWLLQQELNGKTTVELDIDMWRDEIDDITLNAK